MAGAGESGKIEGDTGGKSKGPGLFGAMGRSVVFVLRLMSHRQVWRMKGCDLQF